jgi:hypothetical protein
MDGQDDIVVNGVAQSGFVPGNHLFVIRHIPGTRTGALPMAHFIPNGYAAVREKKNEHNCTTL